MQTQYASQMDQGVACPQKCVQKKRFRGVASPEYSIRLVQSKVARWDRNSRALYFPWAKSYRGLARGYLSSRRLTDAWAISTTKGRGGTLADDR